MNNSVQYDYKSHWDVKFKSRDWGKYPPEDLIRFVFNHYKHCDRSKVEVLEVGCGPGANLWFLNREGFKISGIDYSPTAIELACKLLEKNISETALNLKVGDFSELPWGDNTFDLIIDIFSIYANPIKTIKNTIKEIERVLKPGGLGYSKFWGCNTTGFGSGDKLEHNTFNNISIGPAVNMGVIHFVDEEELRLLFNNFSNIIINKIQRTDVEKGYVIEELICQFQKK